MSDRFKSFKPSSNNNAFAQRNAPPKKTTSRFDSLTDVNSNKNRFTSSKSGNKNNTGNFTKSNKFGRGRRCLRDYSNNKVESRIGKFSQVGTGEVSFTPQFKCGKTTQKQRKRDRKIDKLKVINKKEKDDDWNSLENQEDIALTLAMAQKYQYYTESEEEEEEEEEGEGEGEEEEQY
tara:strand:- start:76 stop:606 length:531 start_codon:yes stop_codon:yes gene_type:complete